MSDIFRNMLDRVGKGGVKCDCCNPYSRDRGSRKKLSGRTRSRIKREDVRGLTSVYDGPMGIFEDFTG